MTLDEAAHAVNVAVGAVRCDSSAPLDVRPILAAFEVWVRADERERAACILDGNVSCPDRSCERCGALRVNAEAIRRGTEPAEEEAANG